MESEQAWSLIELQFETHHRLQQQSLRLIGLLLAVAAISLTGISIAVSIGVGVNLGFSNIDLYVQKAVDDGTDSQLFSRENIRTLIMIELDLVRLALFVVLGLTVRATYFVISALSGPNLRPDIYDIGDAMPETNQYQEWLQYNSEKIDDISVNLDKCYRALFHAVITAASAIGVFVVVFFGVPILAVVPIFAVASSYPIAFGIEEFVDRFIDAEDDVVSAQIGRVGTLFFRLVIVAVVLYVILGNIYSI